MPVGKSWTKKEEALLLQMLQKSISCDDIGKKLVRSKRAVISRANKLGVSISGKKVKKWTAKDTALLRKLKKQGLTYSQIGKRLGRRWEAIAIQAWRMGLTKHTAVWTTEDDVLLRTLCEEGCTQKQIAEKMGWALATIWRRSVRLGLIPGPGNKSS